MSHINLGEQNIYQAQSVLIVWSWPMKNDGPVPLWASQHVQLKHDIGYWYDWFDRGTGRPNLWRWNWDIGRDEAWVEWKPGEGYTNDIFRNLGARAVVAPDRSASIRGNYDYSFVGSLLLPGPAQNSQLRDFWDEKSDRGAQFHLTLGMYQQERQNLRMGASKKLNEHRFELLFSVSTEVPPLRVEDTTREGGEAPNIGIYTY